MFDLLAALAVPLFILAVFAVVLVCWTCDRHHDARCAGRRRGVPPRAQVVLR